MKTPPSVSVLMTTYNREKYVEEAIESVMRSTYSNWELIITDDCSTDKTVELVQKYLYDKRIMLIQNEKNLGDYPNRNKVARSAKGKYIKFLDSDDIIYPHGLEGMVYAMDSHPKAGIGLTFNSYDNSVSLPICLTSEQAYIHHFCKKSILHIGPSGCIYNRSYFEKLGGFNPDFRVASDYEFNMRATLNKPIVLFQKDLFWWREHENQEIIIGSKNNEYVIFNYLINKAIIENAEIDSSLISTILKNNDILMGRRLLKLFPRMPVKDFIRILKATNYPKRYFLRCLLPTLKINSNVAKL
ncbi:Glycosyltransferase involved in cell wall bisynthesis [Flavobacteriaceae bacterium MAR_2010_188]|nr:Glycosyltransferase involved in cell wall bisynthesis [Flavobacteriaceae bacterium MAR_2010_188]